MGCDRMNQIIRSNHIHGYFDGLSTLYGSETGKEGEQQIFLSPQMGNGRIARMKIKPEVEVVISDLTLEEDWNLTIQEEKVFEITYCFSGNTDSFLKGNRFTTQVQSGSAYVVEDSEIHLWMRPKQRYQSLEIRMSPEQVLAYFEDDDENVESWLKYQSGWISPIEDSLALKRAVYELVRSPYRGSLKRLHVESKIMEVMLLVFDKYMRKQNSLPSSCLKKHDIEKLHAAKEIIVDRLENPLSLKELARESELNETKLKKGFKELFGMTVFEFVRDQRLEKGVFLLLTEQLNVGETAAAVGYNNPSNFSAAFYKKYGCNPIQYVKSQKQSGNMLDSATNTENGAPFTFDS